MKQKAQTLPILVNGLAPSSNMSATEVASFHGLPAPQAEEIAKTSPLAQIQKGQYQTPTFLIHGTADDMIPSTQSQRTYEALKAAGVDAEIALIEGAPHLFDAEPRDSEDWKAIVREGFAFLSRHAT